MVQEYPAVLPYHSVASTDRYDRYFKISPARPVSRPACHGPAHRRIVGRCTAPCDRAAHIVENGQVSPTADYCEDSCSCSGVVNLSGCVHLVALDWGTSLIFVAA